MPINFVYSPKFLEFGESGHPESSARLKAIVDFLRKKRLDDFNVPRPCSGEDLMLVHTQEHVNKVRNNLFYDPDTPNARDIYLYAALSCGAAVEACRSAVEGRIAFALSRPPGHHAGKNSVGGFCYFNNIAVAIKKNVLKGGLKAAILDIDGHHGNGTQEIFREEENVIYVSIHQLPAYPGTGSTSFANCYNFPLQGGSSVKKYMDRFMKALSAIDAFSPDVIGISAGFDAHYADPLLELPLEDKEYYLMGKEISALGKKTFCVLEGGYNVSAIGNTCYCFIKGLTEKKDTHEEKNDSRL